MFGFLFSALQFVSKRHPEDAKEVVVWKRFSELRKLHSELAFTHKNLFRREEEFPPFPRAQVFGNDGCASSSNTDGETVAGNGSSADRFHVASSYFEKHSVL